MDKPNKYQKSSIKIRNKDTITKLSTCTSKLSNENKNSRATEKTVVRKTLVRNTQKSVPETRIIKDDLKERLDKKVQTNFTKQRLIEPKNVESSFDVPKVQTLNKLSNQMERLEIIQQKKKDQKLAADEKVLKNLNFPYDKPIYKDLIPLVCEATQYPPSVIRSPLPLKDKEPVLEDFIEKKKIPNYYILQSVDIPEKILPSQNTNLRLYKILDINS